MSAIHEQTNANKPEDLAMFNRKHTADCAPAYRARAGKRYAVR